MGRSPFTRSIAQSDRLPPNQFWGLVVVTFMVLQMPYANIPGLFLSTWAHEFGHGLGALITGGSFYRLQVLPNFSGIATTGTASNFEQLSVIIFGLLGPSLLGAILIFMTRALHLTRPALILLSILLAISLIWARDAFTLVAIGGACVIFALMAWKLDRKAAVFASHLTAIILCLTALSGFGYFFMGGGQIAGTLYRSDTGVMADILGGPYWFWGALLSLLSVAILFVAVFGSDKLARR